MDIREKESANASERSGSLHRSMRRDGDQLLSEFLHSAELWRDFRDAQHSSRRDKPANLADLVNRNDLDNGGCYSNLGVTTRLESQLDRHI
jgi:hypothetical protein